MNKDDEITQVAPPPGYKGHKDEDAIAPPPVPKENTSDIIISYSFGDPALLDASLDRAINNYYKVSELSEELKQILISLFQEKYNDFQINAPNNKWEVKEFILKMSKQDGFKTLFEYNAINKRRNEILEELNDCDPIVDDLKAILEVHTKINDDVSFNDCSIKIRKFLSDVNVLMGHIHLFNFEDIDLVYDSIIEFKMEQESIDKLNKIILEHEERGLIEAEEYYLAREFLNDLTGVTIENIPQVKSNVIEMLDFIKNNQDKDTTSIDLKQCEKYSILVSYLNLKNECISCLHNSVSVKNIDSVLLSFTEDILKGKRTNYKKLVKLLEKEKVPYISYEKLNTNKKVLEQNIDNLIVACYGQSRTYKKENSWKNKTKLVIASATLFTLGLIGYTTYTENYIEIKSNKEITRQLYEDKKDAIKKMESDVLESISNKKVTIHNQLNLINEVKDERIQKIIDKKNNIKEKTKKIIDIIKN